MEQSLVKTGTNQEISQFSYSEQARAFVLKSNSPETRRTYETHIREFFLFHSLKHPTNIAAIDDYLSLDGENRRLAKTGGNDAFVFQSDISRRYFGENKPLTTRHIWHLMKKWVDFAGIGKVTPHDLRRTAITRALDLGHTYRQVQNGSGHKHIQSVQRYDHHRLSLEDNSINKLNYDDDILPSDS